MTPSAHKALETLTDLGDEGATWKQWWNASDMAKSTFTDAQRELVASGYVEKHQQRYFVTDRRGPEGPAGPDSDLSGPLPWQAIRNKRRTSGHKPADQRYKRRWPTRLRADA